MKTPRIAILFGLTASAALPSLVHAEASSCMATAADKKLAGAAKASFIEKCQTDAAGSCNATAADKKLAGAPKSQLYQEMHLWCSWLLNRQGRGNKGNVSLSRLPSE